MNSIWRNIGAFLAEGIPELNLQTGLKKGMSSLSKGPAAKELTVLLENSK